MKWSLILFILFFAGCHKLDKPAADHLSTYYWETTFELDQEEQRFLKEQSSSRMYVRFFDLVFSEAKNEIVPVSQIKWTSKPYSEVVPTIFIQNNIWQHCQTDSIEVLCKKVLDQIEIISILGNVKQREIQLDCDWTLETKDKFFRFVEVCKREKPDLQISCTIRLHQIKFRDNTGVPPCDEGVLMYYNMSEIKADGNNSIFDHEVGKEYLEDLSTYPLKLQLAVPIFKWVIHSRSGEVQALISEWDEATLSDESRFHRIDETHFEVISSGFFSGQYLRENDLLRIERVDQNELESAIKEIREYYGKNFEYIILFELDSKHISDYEKDFFYRLHKTQP